MARTINKIIALLLIVIAPISVIAYDPTQAIDFERDSGQYLNITDATQTGLDFSGDLTFEFHWKPESLVSGGEQQLISKYGDANNRPYRFFFINSGGTQTFKLDTDSTAGSSPEDSAVWQGGGTDFSDLSTGTWYHIAVSKSGTSATLYIGESGSASTSAGSKTSTATIFNGNGDLTVGGRPTGSDHSDGIISLMRLWSSARTQSEIDDNQCLVLGSTTNLQAEWDFDGDALDNSGNSNNLTENNSPTYPSDVPTCEVAGGGATPVQNIIWFD